MRYYAKYKDGMLVCVGTGIGGEEITKEQYHAIRSEIIEKSRYTNMVSLGEISIDEVPKQWRAEIEDKINEYTDIELTAEEVLAELLAELRL